METKTVCENTHNIEYARFTRRPSFGPKVKGDDNKYLQENKELLKRLYQGYRASLIEEHNSIVQANEARRDAYKKKKCYCGGELKLIDGQFGVFWGCSNWRLPTEHARFHGVNPVINDKRVEVKTTWINDIINQAGLKGKVTVKELFQLFTRSGLEDLRMFFGRTSSENSFNQLIIAKNNSAEQEGLAKSKLASLFPKLVCQQCITYKIIGGKESFCIPDFIAGNDDYVLVADAKLHPMYIDDTKMDLYTSLVSFIMINKDDNRPVVGAHILYPETLKDLYKPSRYDIIQL